MLLAENLRPLPATQAYQLWLIETNGKPAISGGLIPSTAGSIHRGFSARVRVESLKGAFLTIESAIGSDTPSRRIVLSGE
jgi:anti-sigma-K factor RskA